MELLRAKDAAEKSISFEAAGFAQRYVLALCWYGFDCKEVMYYPAFVCLSVYYRPITTENNCCCFCCWCCCCWWWWIEYVLWSFLTRPIMLSEKIKIAAFIIKAGVHSFSNRRPADRFFFYKCSISSWRVADARNGFNAFPDFILPPSHIWFMLRVQCNRLPCAGCSSRMQLAVDSRRRASP